jgi:chitin synthase
VVIHHLSNRLFHPLTRQYTQRHEENLHWNGLLLGSSDGVSIPLDHQLSRILTGCASYLMFATVFVTIKSVQSEVKKGFKATDLFQNKTFSTLILSMLSTYVLWFVVSFLFFDAWHMFTSFLQYLLLTPSYINVLNVFALCNTHDLSWGTKGSDGAPSGGSAESGKDDKVKLVVPNPDIQYDKELALLSETPEEEVETLKPDDIKKSYYASVRSGIVMAWIFSNLALCTLVLRVGSIGVITKSAITEEAAESKNSGTYLFIVLWSVAGLSAFRFVGALWFLIHRKVRL